MSLWDFFKNKNNTNQSLVDVKVDMHSHLLPGIDDGSDSKETSFILIQKLIALGYEKFICTPHVMGDFFQNTPEIIRAKRDELRSIAKENQLNITIEAAAEYYLDESFMQRLNTGEELLSFGEKKYVLFELSFMNTTPYFEEAVFLMKSKGYMPVLAHPERYIYWQGNIEKYKKISESGVLLQLNANSLNGYYSKPAMETALKLVENKLISFSGSDTHAVKHIENLQKVKKSSAYKLLLSNPLLNNTL